MEKQQDTVNMRVQNLVGTSALQCLFWQKIVPGSEEKQKLNKESWQRYIL